MSGFSSTWLELREPMDRASRSETVIAALTHAFGHEDIVRITDIGSGTGATLRALGPIFHKASWHLVDNDPALLARAKSLSRNHQVVCTKADLSSDLGVLTTPRPNLVTTSAFLDLVSEEWLEKLIALLKREQLPFYAALSYDGHASTSPHGPNENLVVAAFNRHQKTDKGFGPALGPDAADRAIERFEKAGFLITVDQADWQTSPHDREFMKMLLNGWKEAALEMAPDQSHTIVLWFNECMEKIDLDALTIRVGHKDFLAIPEPE